MSYMLLRTLLAIFSLAALCIGQSASIGLDIDRYLTKRAEMGTFSGAVLVMKEGKVIIRKGYGFADVERRIPYTPETPHVVASITKMFTAMAAVLLRDRGRLRLDDPVCRFVDDCPAAWQPVKIEHLIRHTSGIPDYESKLGLGSDAYLQFMTAADSSVRILADARKLPLNFPPGEKFDYSNTAYILLSRIVERVSGLTYEKFIENEILRPAKMKTAGFTSIGKNPKRLAAGYTYGTLPWEKLLAGTPLTAGHLKRLPILTSSPGHGDGSLYMTVDDLYQWSRVMDGKAFVPQRDVTEVFTAGQGGYGYGWFVGKGFDRPRVRHNGALPGYLSNIDKYTDDGLTLILFSNLDRARLSNIARDMAAIALGKPWDMPVQGTVIRLTTEQISTLEGDYEMADGSILSIKNEPDYLTATLPDRFTVGLIPLSPSEFYFPLADGRAIFKLSETGVASSVNLRYSGEDHIAHRKQ